jgi:hypothetical protein
VIEGDKVLTSPSSRCIGTEERDAAEAVSNLPAEVGGTDVPDGLPLARPTIADPGLGRQVERIVASEVLTNGPTVRRLEERAAEYLGVRHCVAVASCTTGLMLVLRAAEVSGDVIAPSVRSAATAHAVAWNGLRRCSRTSSPDR